MRLIFSRPCRHKSGRPAVSVAFRFHSVGACMTVAEVVVQYRGGGRLSLAAFGKLTFANADKWAC